MWALHRAANPVRNHGNRIVVTCVCCTQAVSPGGYVDPGRVRREKCYTTNDNYSVQKSFSLGSSFSVTSSLRTRNLSSHAGMKSNDSTDDLEDGLPDLEIPPERNKTGETGEQKDGVDIASDGDGLFEDANDPLGLSDSETYASGEKSLSSDSSKSPLFKVIAEASPQNVDDVLNKWVEEGKPMGRNEITMAMLNLRMRRLFGKALQFAEWLEANKSIDLVERDYASHLDLVAKNYGLQRAEKYIEKIPQFFRGEVVYRTLLANCVAVGYVKKAEEVFNKIRDLDFPISAFAWNQLLLLYKRVDRKKIADVLLMMEKENVKPSIFTYTVLLDAKGRSNDISGMEQILETMKAEGIVPDLVIHAMVAKHYILGGLKEKAEATLKEMEGDDIKENRAACKAVIPLYAALGKADDVGRIWKICEVNPRLDECLAIIEAWGKLGQVEKAEKVFEDVLKTWDKPSPKYYNQLLKVYGKHKLLSKGQELAKRMSDKGSRIGPLTVDALIKLYAESGEVEKADLILQKAMQQNQIKLLYSSYMVLLDKYAKRGDINNAERIFQHMRLTGYRARRQYQTLLETYINAKAPVYGFRERMKADNMFPNKATAAQLVAVDAFRKNQISELLD